MKKIFTIIILLVCTQAKAQTSSSQYTSFMYDEMIDMDKTVTDSFPSYILRRVEMGVMTFPSNKKPFASLSRYLYPGNEYAIHVFTDKRVTDFKMILYKQRDGKTIDICEVDKKSNTNTTSLLGDMEWVFFSPDDSGYYDLDVVSVNETNDVARYCAMVWSKSSSNSSSGLSSSSSSGKTYYSISNKRVCDYSNTTKKFDQCGNLTSYPSMMELNSDRTVFKHTTPDITSYYYIQNTTWNSDINGYIYTVKSNAGNTYTFAVPDAGDYIAVFNTHDTPNYRVLYDVTRTWKE